MDPADISSLNTASSSPSRARSGAESFAPSEADLVARVLAGDRMAFAGLVRVYEPTVFAICCRQLHGDRAEAEDLSQETFLRAYRRLAELKDPRRFGPWVYQIARSLCRDFQRHMMAERRALQVRGELAALEAAGAAETLGADVQSVLASLPADERQALELKYYEGLSYQEIASRLGLSFSKVDHLIRGARQRLSRRLVLEGVQSEPSM
ncbi:MAG: sigma-70 family RNA polymerase sigma factor [Planctomycetota bacterium]